MKIFFGQSVVIALTVMFSTASALAEPTALEECWQTADTRLDLAPCLQTMLNDVNRKMTDTTKQLRQSMRELELVTGRQAYTEAFEVSQQAFVQFRQANCAWRYVQASPGTGAGDFQLSCLIDMTRDRIKELSKALHSRQ